MFPPHDILHDRNGSDIDPEYVIIIFQTGHMEPYHCNNERHHVILSIDLHAFAMMQNLRDYHSFHDSCMPTANSE